jgi:hypothetical protein
MNLQAMSMAQLIPEISTWLATFALEPDIVIYSSNLEADALLLQASLAMLNSTVIRIPILDLRHAEWMAAIGLDGLKRAQQ